MLNLKNTKISISLWNILDKIFFALQLILMMAGLIFLFGFVLKFIIINPNIYKTNKSVQHSMIILKKYSTNR